MKKEKKIGEISHKLYTYCKLKNTFLINYCDMLVLHSLLIKMKQFILIIDNIIQKVNERRFIHF